MPISHLYGLLPCYKAQPMIPYGLLCSLGIRGGVMLGITAAEILISYWNSRYNIPPKVYVFNRRIHHGEIGTLLALSSLLLRGTSIPTATAAILAAIGIGLVRDDCGDIREWFRLKKRKIEDRKQTKTTVADQEKGVSTAAKEHDDCRDNKGKKVIEELVVESLRKQIRNLIDTESQTIKQIELQIRESRKQRLPFEKR
jgi:hypothetical protein